MHRGDADKRWASSVTEMHFYIKPKHELYFTPKNRNQLFHENVHMFRGKPCSWTNKCCV